MASPSVTDFRRPPHPTLRRVAVAIPMLLLFAGSTAIASANLPAPTELTAEGEAGFVQLAWSLVDGDEWGYTVYRSAGSCDALAPLGQVSWIGEKPSQMRYQDKAVSAGTLYCYAVAAYDGDGDGPLGAGVFATPTAGPDLAIASMSIGSGDVPTAKQIVLGIHNHGEGDAAAVTRVVAKVCPQQDERGLRGPFICRSLEPLETGPLAAGDVVEIALAWDATGQIGNWEVCVEAHYASYDLNVVDNARCATETVLVPGPGVGV